MEVVGAAILAVVPVPVVGKPAAERTTAAYCADAGTAGSASKPRMLAPAKRPERRCDGRLAAAEHGCIVNSSWIRSEEHTSELQSLMRISYAVFCLKKKNIETSNDKSKR